MRKKIGSKVSGFRHFLIYVSFKMKNKSILVIGGDGMLGHMVVSKLIKQYTKIIWTTHKKTGHNGVLNYDALEKDPNHLFEQYGPFDIVINCSGILKMNIDEKSETSISVAQRINTELPHILADLVSISNGKMIHISTDDVFSNDTYLCDEYTEPKPTNIYGLTKLKGEPKTQNVITLRLSIIGPNPNYKYGVYEWVKSLASGSTINGFINQLWTGCTTNQLTRHFHVGDKSLCNNHL